ncbi:MAG TPA: M28 family peptidase [Solirubrobacterales bacterium]
METSEALAVGSGEDVEDVERWITLLCEEVGPRRPTSRSEAVAATAMRGELRAEGVDAETEPYPGYSSFAWPYGLILAAAVAPALLPPRLRRTRAGIAAAAAGAMALEGELRTTPVSDLLARREGRSLVATLEPRAEARRTLCLVSHLDSSRSGLLFHPGAARLLGRWITLQSLGVLVGAAEPLLSRSRPGRWLLAAARSVAAAGLALLAERELRGSDVQGANDNASGVAVAARLIAERAANRPANTRLVFLATGGEEAGLLGAQEFLRRRDTGGWIFLNFDGVGAPATLRYLSQEGVFRRWPADAGLVRLAGELAERRPELGLERQEVPAGLTYDTTPVLARGGRAMTLSAQDETIPNLHTPSDVPESLDRDTLRRSLEVGRELIAAIDRGEAD